MKNGIVMYEKIYRILKNKIECGLLPSGSRLPSRTDLCREFGTSEKTVRHAVKLLSDYGLVETGQRKRPTVTFDYSGALEEKRLLPLRKADVTTAGDLLKTGIFLCYPIIQYGIDLCGGNDWHIPEAILGKMEPDRPIEFWRLSNRFWRFFIARTGNDFILRAVDSLGLSELDPLPGSLEVRTEYFTRLKEFLYTIKTGGKPTEVRFADLSFLYRFLPDGGEHSPVCKVASDSPFRLGAKELGRRISWAEEQYSRVYLDLLGLIAIGKYRPGDRLPSHAGLRQIYGVSVDTTIKAVQLLKQWGVVTAVRGKGIFVAMGPEKLRHIPIDPALVAYHVRRYLDSLELLSLTAEGVAAHAAAHDRAVENAGKLGSKLEDWWNNSYLYQLSPIVLLEFLTDYIEYSALRTVYKVIQKNYHIGRSIPKLLHHAKNRHNREIHRQCVEAAEALASNSPDIFAKKAAEMFRYTHQLIIRECKRLGYWQPAMRVYDGTLLWK